MKNQKTKFIERIENLSITSILIIIALVVCIVTFTSSCKSIDPAARYQKEHKDKMFTGYKKLK